MKIRLREFGVRYATYEFGYSLMAERESADVLDDIYQKGFLPYSGNLAVHNNFYMARSARVRARELALSSENRRIKSKFAQMPFTVDEFPAKDFADNAEFLEFCTNYFNARHGAGVMPTERLQFIMRFCPELMLVRFREGDAVRAYVLEIRTASLRHYWFSFYDLSFAYKSFGAYLMLASIEAAQSAGITHVYLGTVYGEKALYKTNFGPLEFWDGNGWVEDVPALKSLARSDVK